MKDKDRMLVQEGSIVIFYRVIGEDCHDKVTLEPKPKGIETKNIPGKEISKCKDLDVKMYLTYLRNNKETGVAKGE